VFGAALLVVGLCAGGYRPIVNAVQRAAREGNAVVAVGQYEWLGACALVAAVLFFVAASLGFLKAMILRYSAEFAVTDKRVLLKQGIFSSKSLEIVLAKVESIYVEQGVFGRILDYGSLVVIGTGGTRDVYSGMASPMAFRRAIQEQIAAGNG
jgi:uncharacterized membrane protein YdbT with pleckstrin-like domain